MPKKESIMCNCVIQIIIIQFIFAGMSETNMGQKGERLSLDNNQIGRKRRTRNDQDGRNFSCNCGKSYLSYPALYTHVKTKHNGKVQFTKFTFSKQQNESADLKEQEDISSVQKIQDSNNIEQLKKYLTKFFPLSPKDKEFDKKFKDFTKEDQNFLRNIKEYWEKRKKQDQPHQNQAYSTPIDFVLGKFLIDVDSEISKTCSKFLSEFILNLHKELNHIKNNEQYCKSNNASQLPTLMNEIFIQKFQKMQESHIYLRHPTIICKTIYHFSRWLFQQRFTNLSLKFNTL